MLKILYCLMQSSLSNDVIRDGDVVESIELKFENMTALSSTLFEELREKLSFGLHRTATPMNRNVNWTDSSDSLEELLLLLRCCVLIVRLRPHDHALMRKFIDVVSLHRMLRFPSTQIERRSSISFTKVASSQSMHSSCSTSLSNDLRSKSCDSCIFLLKRVLEVILDEMFGDRHFRERIEMLYTFSSDRKQSTCSSIHIASMLDVITAHFVLSVSGEHFLETFTESLIWTKREAFCKPDLSLSAAISLVKHPVISPPIILSAHLISLVSDVVGICDPHDRNPNIRYLEYLSVFRDSVVMYCEHMSKLLMDSCGSSHELRRSSRTVAKPHFHSEIYDKINFMLTGSDSSWRVHVSNTSADTKSRMETDAITYLKMNMEIFDEPNRDEVFSFLSSLIIRVMSSEADESLCIKIKKMTVQEFCLLASMLKLMSCTLLQATSLKKRLSSLKSSSKGEDAFHECHSFVGIMSCLAKYKLHVPFQVLRLVDDILKPQDTTHGDSKMILTHLAGLLSLCKLSGLNFLVKGCLFTMMVFINMVIFEEVRLDFSRPSSYLSSESHALASTTANFTGIPMRICCKDPFIRIDKCRPQQKSSLKVALDFQKIRKLLLRDKTTDEEAQTTNGEAYLRHFTSNPDVISELADFIVCKPEKNYTTWLRNRAESRHKRCKKFARRRWERKKMACNLTTGRKISKKVGTKCWDPGSRSMKL